jgi:hypothetical protein
MLEIIPKVEEHMYRQYDVVTNEVNASRKGLGNTCFQSLSADILTQQPSSRKQTLKLNWEENSGDPMSLHFLPKLDIHKLDNGPDHEHSHLESAIGAL